MKCRGPWRFGLGYSPRCCRALAAASVSGVTEAIGLPIYFCEPHSPWQRGSNENMNGLLRQYFPKGTELRQYTQKHLDVVAAQLNRRPRKRYGYATPDEMIETLTGAMTA